MSDQVVARRPYELTRCDVEDLEETGVIRVDNELYVLHLWRPYPTHAYVVGAGEIDGVLHPCPWDDDLEAYVIREPTPEHWDDDDRRLYWESRENLGREGATALVEGLR